MPILKEVSEIEYDHILYFQSVNPPFGMNDLILSPVRDHNGSTITFRGFGWIVAIHRELGPVPSSQVYFKVLEPIE